MKTRSPLDPLSLEEVQESCDLLKKIKKLNQDFRFANVMTHEPSQQEELYSKEFDRLVFICVFDSKQNETFEAIVNLTQKNVVQWEKVAGQPPILVEEAEKCERILKSNTPWLNSVLRPERGLTNSDIKNIQVDPFSAGNFGDQSEQGKRLINAVSYYRKDLKDNGYAHPIEGVVATVDLVNETVKVIDDHQYIPVPKKEINYNSQSYPNKQANLKPLEITQPEGPSFSVNGWEVKWSNWKFRVGFTPREGLVLYKISYEQENQQEIPLVYRASITEMLVPYADPSSSHFWKSAFDAGEYGLGTHANHLKKGCDCLGEIYYFDVAASDNSGNAFLMKNAICMHEEDASILWKHDGEVRRARELVLSFFTTIGNYDYGFYWRLCLDGTLKLEIKLTGIVQTAAIYPNIKYQWGSHLTQELVAPYHQHFFNVRMHMMVGGENNSFSESEFYTLPISTTNPYGIAFSKKETSLKNESEAAREADTKVGRSWKVFNPNVQNEITQPISYQFDIPAYPLLFAHPESAIFKRGEFASKHIWVTPYHPKEKYAAGDYPNQHPGGAGLPSYIKQKRSIENQSLVVWVNLGTTHSPRPEDFPVMPVASVSFSCRPFGFFKHNPTMNLPVEYNKKTKNECCDLKESKEEKYSYRL